ncbi:hypothetical protein MKZ20_02835 [Psychrobacillus sp. FSL K6-2684]|uniref:hypothetical protein n=1 Tax=Psychrobacillus sp. FSL K6-2684 TaxID=2921547 RepID=UPI0030F6674B
MEVRKVIRSEGIYKYVKSEKIKFELDNIKKYQEMFDELVNDNRIKGSFNDQWWYLPSRISKNDIAVNFDIEVYKELNIALKSYTVVQLYNNRTPSGVRTKINSIKKTLLSSEGFTSIEKLKKYLDQRSILFPMSAYWDAKDAMAFLDFNPVSKVDEILLKYIHSYVRTNRNLPSFEFVIEFDEVIHDYFIRYPREETLKFMPIEIWWKLTNIIPMRPSELALLKINCLEQKSNNTYWITIPRIKNQTDLESESILYEQIQIDNITYEFMLDCKFQVLSLNPETDAFFPNELYRLSHPKQYTKSNISMNRVDIHNVLNKFYQNVLLDLYGIDLIEKIRLGDTRHFAIINMFLQGFSMLSIQRMAGHISYQTQDNYYSHAEHFASSYVYRLAQRKLENDLSQSFSDGFMGWTRYQYDKGLITDKNIFNMDEIVGEVEYGLCLEKKENHPNTCVEDCRYCDKFLFQPPINDYDIALKWLQDSSEHLNLKIKESFEIMINLCKSLNKTFSPNQDNLLKTHANQLVAYMDYKATVDAKLLERGEMSDGKKS